METTTPFHPLAGDSSFEMIDIGDKAPSRRHAIAEGTIYLSEEAFIALRDGKNPKGNVLALAETAAIIVAKKTAELIPLCHPLPLNYIRVRFQLKGERFSVTTFCEVGTFAKTGVEMEALAGVNGALLTIYDLSKAVNPVLTISDIRLNLKEGGKSGRWTHPDYQEPSPPQSPTLLSLQGTRAAVLTVSDRVSQGRSVDRSGPVLVDLLERRGAEVIQHSCVPDEIDSIRNAVLQAIRQDRSQLVFTTGGTGVSLRDVTPEALQGIADKTIAGLGELLRKEGSHSTNKAWLSRSSAYVIEGALVVTLPGSTNAVEEGVKTLDALLPHTLHILRGGNHDSLR